MNKIIPLALAASALVNADTLVLKNGTQIEGVYVGGDARTVKFDANDRITSYSISDVEDLRFGSEPHPSSQGTTQASPPAVAATSAHGTIEIPANTPIIVRLIDPIHSEAAAPGSVYRASLDTPVYYNGRIVVPGYSSALAQLLDRSNSGHMTGKTTLTLALTKIVVYGTSYPVETTDVVEASGNRGANSAKITGGTAAAGAIIGAIAGGGRGAAIGAGSGAAVGAAASILRPGQKINLSAETKLTFRLASPLTIPAQQ